jgi:hypothetical protein
VRVQEHLSHGGTAVLAIVCRAYFIAINSQERCRLSGWWLRKFLQDRKSHGVYKSVLSELRIEDRRGFEKIISMTPTDFKVFLNMMSPFISPKNTSFRHALPSSDQLTVILRYDDLLGSLMYLFRIFRASISILIPEVCNAIITALRKYVKAYLFKNIITN